MKARTRRNNWKTHEKTRRKGRYRSACEMGQIAQGRQHLGTSMAFEAPSPTSYGQGALMGEALS